VGVVWVTRTVRHTMAENRRFEATFGVDIRVEQQRLMQMRR
jgi:hypothetical protein